MKLAYALLNKVGSHKEGTSIMTGDRVSRHIVEYMLCSLISRDVWLIPMVSFILYMHLLIGPLCSQWCVTCYKIQDAKKPAAFRDICLWPVKLDFPLLWTSQYMAWSPAWWIFFTMWLLAAFLSYWFSSVMVMFLVSRLPWCIMLTTLSILWQVFMVVLLLE